MKRGQDELGHGGDAAKRRAMGPTGPMPPGPVQPGPVQRMADAVIGADPPPTEALKLLLSAGEARVIQDSTTMTSLENLTGTRVKLSDDEELYPGTQLRELTVRGGTLEAVLNAVRLAISEIVDVMGAVTGGEAGVEPDGARLKVVVPREVAVSLDGPSLQQLGTVRGVQVRVVPTLIPPGSTTELSEQVVCFSGALDGVQGALQAVARLVAALASRSWFGRWAGHSHCGLRVPGLVLLPGGQAPNMALRTRWDEGADVSSNPGNDVWADGHCGPCGGCCGGGCGSGGARWDEGLDGTASKSTAPWSGGGGGACGHGWEEGADSLLGKGNSPWGAGCSAGCSPCTPQWSEGVDGFSDNFGDCFAGKGDSLAGKGDGFGGKGDSFGCKGDGFGGKDGFGCKGDCFGGKGDGFGGKGDCFGAKGDAFSGKGDGFGGKGDGFSGTFGGKGDGFIMGKDGFCGKGDGGLKGDAFKGDGFKGDGCFKGDATFKGGDIFKGDTFKGETFKGETFKGETFKGDSFKGDAFKGDAFKGDGFKGDGFKGDGFKGDCFGGKGWCGGRGGSRWDEGPEGMPGKGPGSWGGCSSRWDEGPDGPPGKGSWSGCACDEGAEGPLGKGAMVPWAGSGYGGKGKKSRGGVQPGELAGPCPWAGELSGPWTGAASAQGAMGLKLLLGPEELAVLRAGGAAAGAEIQRSSGAELRFALEGEVYPGTQLEELGLLGPSATAVSMAGTEALGRIVDARGSLGVNSPALEPGAAHMKVVIPSKATAAVIGPGGQVVGRIRAQTQMHVHVETTTVPLGGFADISEQVVSFDGPLPGVQPALTMIGEILSQFMNEPWFGLWAANSNSGHVIPGLVLFQDVKGKSKGKGKIKGKEPPSWCGGGFGGLTMKLLLSPNEASCVLGKGGTAVREIGQVTGTRMSLSGRDQFYPGTQLQEMIVKGSTQESVLAAVWYSLERIAELSGAVSGGEGNVEPGGCRLKVVVPSQSASAIIGPAGSFVKSMRERSRMHIHVEETTIPPGPPTELTDQVVSLSGPLEGARVALAMLAEAIGSFSNEPWFEAWSSHSHCGVLAPGLVLFADGKGKSKAKGKPKGWKGEDDDYSVVAPDYMQGSSGLMLPGGDKGSDGSWAGMETTGMTLKMLVSSEEVGVLSADSSTMIQIQQATSTTGMLSEKSYPGTSLQELTIQGPSPDAVLQAILLILNKVSEVVGVVRSGEQNVPPGDARVKLVVPKRAAAAIIGPGGQNVKQLKVQAGIHVHVDANSIPCGFAVSEQGVCLAGPVASIQVALTQVVTEVANCCCEPWFEVWAQHSNAGHIVPGLILFEGKGKGGCKGPPVFGGCPGQGAPFI